MELQRNALIAPSIYDGAFFHQNSALLIDEKHRVIEVVPQSQIPNEFVQHQFQGVLLPGFVDLQVNGGGGVLFNDEPTIEGLTTIIKAHQERGTAALLPTLISADDLTIKRALSAVQKGISQEIPGLLGIHIEGPMINPIRKGIHHLPNLRILSDEIIDQICSSTEFIRLVTLAPEIVPLTLIEKLVKSGVIVFAGHTEATPTQLMEAIDAGLCGFTHLYNAMPAMESRNPKTTCFAIQSKETYASIIHDKLHVDPLMVKLAFQSKPKGKLFLVSDAMSSIGAEESMFILDDQTIFLQDGKLVNADGTLAGAHVDMATSVLNSAQLLDISLEEAFAMGTSTPANIIQSNQYGYLKKGYKATINEFKGGKITPVIF